MLFADILFSLFVLLLLGFVWKTAGPLVCVYVMVSGFWGFMTVLVVYGIYLELGRLIGF